MKKYARGIPAALLALFLLLCAGCSAYSAGKTENRFHAGETVTPELIVSIAAEVSAAQTEKYRTETSPEGDPVVFWTAGGSVWHISRDCSSLAKSSDIQSGSQSDAEAAGKTRACSRCAANK